MVILVFGIGEDLVNLVRVVQGRQWAYCEHLGCKETLRMAMATSSQVGLFSSPFFCSSAVQPKQTGASSRELACGPSVAARPQMKVICQKEEEVDVSRRFIAVAASATALGIFVQPEAQAARRKPPAPEEKKVEEDKGLSAYDARLLANARRKEAMKATLEAQKAKAGSVATTQ